MAAVRSTSHVKLEPIEVIDDDDEDELESLRLAALQTIRPKEQSPPRTAPPPGQPVPELCPPLPPPQVRPATVYMCHKANPNLIAIVPVNPTLTEPPNLVHPVQSTRIQPIHKRSLPGSKLSKPLILPQSRYCNSLNKTVSEEKPKEVPTKFSRIDASDSESDDDDLLKKRASSDDDDDDDDDNNEEDNDGGASKNVTETGKTGDENNQTSTGFAELEDDDSLEKLMEVMEQEFSQGTKKSSKNTKKKTSKVSEEKIKVKIKQEKVDETEGIALLESVKEPKNIVIKKEVIDDDPVGDGEFVESKQMEPFDTPTTAVIEPNLKEMDNINFSENRDDINETVDIKKKSNLDKVTSSAMSSPLRIRSPREVNLKFMQKQSPLDSSNPVRNEKYVYVPIISDNSDNLNVNIDCLGASRCVPDGSTVIPCVKDLPVQKRSVPVAPLNFTEAFEPTGQNIPCLPDPSRRSSNECDVYRRSRSPRKMRSDELSPIRRSCSPRNKGLSPRRYVSPRSRGRSPVRRSLSPRIRNKNFSPRRSVSPRKYSRSPIPYSASPSPVGRWHSNSRSPFRRSRSRSWSRSRSRSYSRLSSPYYRRRSWSSRRSFSRSLSPRTRNLPEKRLSPRRSSLSPIKRDYSPRRGSPNRGFYPERRRRISVSPRRKRSRSPSYPYRLGSPPYAAFSPKRNRLSPSPPRIRKSSVSPRRRRSPIRSNRVSVSPRRSPIPHKCSPKRMRTSVSPIYRQRLASLSPRRRNSPVRSRISVSPRKRSFSPRKSPLGLKRASVSPRRRYINSPLRREARNSLSPSRQHLSPRRNSPSHPRMSRQSPVQFKNINRGSYADHKHKDSLRKISPFSRRPISPWKNESQSIKRSSVSPRRHPADPKLQKATVSPERSSELPSKRQSVSPKRLRHGSPRRNLSPGARKSCSPLNRSPLRKSSPLVVRRVGDNRRPLHHKESGRPPKSSNQVSASNRSRSQSQGLSPGKDASGDRSRPSHVTSNEQVNRKRGGSPLDYYSHHGYNQRKRNFVERNKERDLRRRDRNRDVRDWDRDRERGRIRDVKDREKFREKGRHTIQRERSPKDGEKPKTKVEEKKPEEKTEDKNVFSDPILEARRRKFESNRPVQPLNKKIRLKTKTVSDERNYADTTVEDKVVSEPEQPVRVRKVDSFSSNKIEMTSIMEPDSNSRMVEVEPQICTRIIRTDSNKSLDKACNTDDVLDIGGDGLLLTDDELENEIFGEDFKVEKKKVVVPHRKEEKRAEPTKKEPKQVKVKPRIKHNSGVDKACSPLIVPKKDEVTDDEQRIRKEREDEEAEQEENEFSRREKKEMDLRAALSRRRAERLTKAGSVHESLPKRLLQSAFSGLMGEKTRVNSKEFQRKSHKSSQLQSQVHVQAAAVAQPIRKERPVEGRRRVLLLNRPTPCPASSAPARKATKAAVKISFPKGLQESDSQSESEDDDDDTTTDEEEEQEDISEEDEERDMVLKDRSRGRSRLQRLPIHLRLGLTTGHCPRRKVKLRRRNQV